MAAAKSSVPIASPLSSYSMVRPWWRPDRNWAMNCALESKVEYMKVSNELSWQYLMICTSSNWLPDRTMRPSRCSMFAGVQAGSRWCKAASRVWMFTPVPALAVDATSTDTSPWRHRRNRASLAAGLSWSWTNSISARGTPRASSSEASASYTVNALCSPGVPRSQNTIWHAPGAGCSVPVAGSRNRRSAWASLIRATRSAQAWTLEGLGWSTPTRRRSRVALRPSLQMLSMLSHWGFSPRFSERRWSHSWYATIRAEPGTSTVSGAPPAIAGRSRSRSPAVLMSQHSDRSPASSGRFL